MTIVFGMLPSQWWTRFDFNNGKMMVPQWVNSLALGDMVVISNLISKHMLKIRLISKPC